MTTNIVLAIIHDWHLQDRYGIDFISIISDLGDVPPQYSFRAPGNAAFHRKVPFKKGNGKLSPNAA
jgi:hypothetical protein